MKSIPNIQSKILVKALLFATTFLFCLVQSPKVFALSQFGASANVVIGQPDLNTVVNNRRGSYGQMDYLVKDGKLYIAVYNFAGRVDVFNSIPTESFAEPNYTIGKPTINNVDPFPYGTADTMYGPQAIAICQNILFVSEFLNNRISVFNPVPTTNGATASFVLGQTAYTSTEASPANAGGISAHSLNTPRGVACDDTHLVVGDTANNRVLIWNGLPTTMGEDADIVLGQPTLTSNTANNGGITAHSISGPSKVFIYGGKLYVADSANNRVLIWNTIPTTNNQDADLVLGQPNFTSNTANNGGISAHSLSSPRGVMTDGTKLYVADYTNNRVLIWNTLPTTNNADASVVIGQPDFTSNTANNGGLDASAIKNPVGVYAYGDKLFIADYGNYRSVVFNTIPTTNGASADIVLGQATFESLNPNSAGTPTARNLFSSSGIFGINGKVFVADTRAARVLMYNSVPTTSGADANYVIGQPDFSTISLNALTGAPPTATSLYGPSNMASDGTKFFLTDSSNHRVLIYNTFPTANGVPADIVLGQTNMTSNTSNSGGRSAQSLFRPFGIAVCGTKLVVADGGNHRVLIYNSIPTTDFAAANLVLGQPDFSTGTANTGGISASSFNNPTSITCSSSKLIVTDGLNYRVLIWNTFPTSNNQPADVVVGQPDFITATPSNGGVTAKSFSNVTGVYYDGTRLFAADKGRILVFNTLPVSNFASADAVIGQMSFTTNVPNRGVPVDGSTISLGGAITSTSDKLFILDTYGYRVLVFPLGPQHASVTLPALSNSTSASLTLAADDAKDMMISTDASFTGASWESFSTSKVLTLSAGDGTKTYYVKFRDYADYEGGSTTVSTILDTTAPTGALQITSPLSSGKTKTRNITIGVTADGTGSAVTEMMLSESPTLTGASWESYAASKAFTLSSGDGSKTVYAKVRDATGNESVIFSISVVLSTKTPSTSSSTTQSSSGSTTTVTPTPTATTEPTETPTPTITVYGFQVKDQQGNILKNTTVYINGQRYETDGNGKLYLQNSVTQSAKIEVVVNGKKYESSILGETITAQVAQTATKPANYSWLWLVLALTVIVGIYVVYRRQGKSKPL